MMNQSANPSPSQERPASPVDRKPDGASLTPPLRTNENEQPMDENITTVIAAPAPESPPPTMTSVYSNSQPPIITSVWSASLVCPTSPTQSAPRPILPRLLPSQGNSPRSAIADLQNTPDFYDKVYALRASLYEKLNLRQGVDELPKTKSMKWKRWRTAQRENSKINLSHYFRVAELSNRCFEVVRQINEKFKRGEMQRVRAISQYFFLFLINKDEEAQFKLLHQVLEGEVTVAELMGERNKKRSHPTHHYSQGNSSQHQSSSHNGHISSVQHINVPQVQPLLATRKPENEGDRDFHEVNRLGSDFEKMKKEKDLLREENKRIKSELGKTRLENENLRNKLLKMENNLRRAERINERQARVDGGPSPVSQVDPSREDIEKVLSENCELKNNAVIVQSRLKSSEEKYRREVELLLGECYSQREKARFYRDKYISEHTRLMELSVEKEQQLKRKRCTNSQEELPFAKIARRFDQMFESSTNQTCLLNGTRDSGVGSMEGDYLEKSDTQPRHVTNGTMKQERSSVSPLSDGPSTSSDETLLDRLFK